jgi:hypothetical protein
MFPHKATILIEEEDYKNLNASKVLEQINKEI